VIPSSLLGLVVLAASIGPGYVWVRVAETRVPRGPRTQLLEIAELIVIGGLASTLSFLFVLSLASAISFIDADALAADGTTYVLKNPARGFGVIFAGLALAYGLAYGAAWFVYRKRPARIQHGFSAWYSLLSPEEHDEVVYATVDLRDGTTIAGWVFLCTVDEVPPGERDLVLVATLGKRLKVRPANSETFYDSPNRAVIVNGADVLAVSSSYYSQDEIRAKREAV
jgi:hypothetical protein